MLVKTDISFAALIMTAPPGLPAPGGPGGPVAGAGAVRGHLHGALPRHRIRAHQRRAKAEGDPAAAPLPAHQRVQQPADGGGRQEDVRRVRGVPAVSARPAPAPGEVQHSLPGGQHYDARLYYYCQYFVKIFCQFTAELSVII